MVANIKDLSQDKVKDRMIYEVVRIMNDLCSDEMGPISANAQKKVAVPEELDLKENLADLSEFVSDDDATMSRSNPSVLFSSHSRHASEEVEAGPIKVESSSLEEHRRRYGLYYLSADKETPETELTEDYPRVNESLPPSNGDPARRVKVTKPRPTVVKLDEGEESTTSSSLSTKVEVAKNDPLSGAIKDVLLARKGNEASGYDASSSSQGKGKDKEREIKSKKGEEGESKVRQKGRRKHKHRKESAPPVSVAQENPVIQDFLL